MEVLFCTGLEIAAAYPIIGAMQDRPMPEKAAKRLAELVVELVPALEEAVAQGQPADSTLGRIFRARPEFGSRDRRFLGDAAFSWFRWRGWLDLTKLPLPTRIAVACLLDTNDVHPAVTVLLENARVHFESPKAIGHTSITDKATQVAQWLKLPAPPLLHQLVPPWLPDALACPAPDFAKCVTAFQQRPPTWLRVADGHTDTVITALGASGIEVTRHPRMPLALAVPGTSGLAQLDHAIKTRFEIQDLASQSVGLVCSPQAGERWWDICAGSGGKSLHLADVTKNHGTIYATDVRESALDELRRRAKRAGATCIKVGVEPDELVHGVLVDAPCSGIGTWSRNPDARWRTTAHDVSARSEIQKKILHRAADRVRPGGTLVYAVCTLTTIETAGVIGEFLRLRPDFRLQPFPNPLTGATTDGKLWIWPWEGPCDGMFVAKMARVASSDPNRRSSARTAR